MNKMHCNTYFKRDVISLKKIFFCRREFTQNLILKKQIPNSKHTLRIIVFFSRHHDNKSKIIDKDDLNMVTLFSCLWVHPVYVY